MEGGGLEEEKRRGENLGTHPKRKSCCALEEFFSKLLNVITMFRTCYEKYVLVTLFYSPRFDLSTRNHSKPVFVLQ